MLSNIGPRIFVRFALLKRGIATIFATSDCTILFSVVNLLNSYFHLENRKFSVIVYEDHRYVGSVGKMENYLEILLG